MRPSYYFVTDCIHSTGELIQEMVDQSTEVSWRTFSKYVPVSEVRQIFPDYSYHGETYNDNGDLTISFHIKDDYAVSFWRSRYKGRRCYYITHSAIEYIFQQ